MENISGLLEYKGEDVEFLISNDGLGFWQISFEGVDVGDNSVLQELHYIFGKIEITGELEEVKDAWAEIFESEGISFTFYGGQDHRDAQTLFEVGFLKKLKHKLPGGNLSKKNKNLKKKNSKANLKKINQEIKKGNYKISFKSLENFFDTETWVFEAGDDDEKSWKPEFDAVIGKNKNIETSRAILILDVEDKTVSFTKIVDGSKGVKYQRVEETFEDKSLADEARERFNDYFGNEEEDNYKKQFVKVEGDGDSEVNIWLSKGKCNGAFEDLNWFIKNDLPKIFGTEKKIAQGPECVDLSNFKDSEFTFIPALF